MGDILADWHQHNGVPAGLWPLQPDQETTMISVRGPDSILVVDRTAVPVEEVCAAVLDSDAKEQVIERFPINDDELFGCLEVFSDTQGPLFKDFVEISCTNDAGETLEIETLAVSDWVYLTAVYLGYQVFPNENRFYTLYALGMESVMYDCLLDLKNGRASFNHSDIHRIVFDAFIRAYGDLTDADIEKLLVSLKEDGFPYDDTEV